MKSYDQENHLISTIQELNYNQPNTNATVIWIPAHQGIEGNEKADAAAKEATVTNNGNHLPIPCDDQIIHCKKVAKNEWNNPWKTTKSTQLHKSIQDFHQQAPSFNNRKEGIIITRLRTGHTKLTREHKIKKTTPPTCTHCNNHPLTITHMLHECHTTETQRQKYGINANINLSSHNDIQRVLLHLKSIYSHQTSNYYSHI